jgi:hypothetical protein
MPDYGFVTLPVKLGVCYPPGLVGVLIEGFIVGLIGEVGVG